MSNIARLIAGASQAERLAEFQRVEPTLRQRFKEHLEKEGRPQAFEQEYPAIQEAARQRALTSPDFGRQAIQHAAGCRCESHRAAPAAAPVAETLARRIAGPIPAPKIDVASVTEKEISRALESHVKPKFVQWCTEEKLPDAEAAWKERLPKLTESFKASKHFGTSILAIREADQHMEAQLTHLKTKFDQWAATQGLSPEAAEAKWANDVKPKAEIKLAATVKSMHAQDTKARATNRIRGDEETGRNYSFRKQGMHHRQLAGHNGVHDAPGVQPHERVPRSQDNGGGWNEPHPHPAIGKAERRGRPGPGGREASPYGVNKKARQGLKKAADEIDRMEGLSAKEIIDRTIKG